ncbi:cyclin-dependent kinase G-1 [Niveomyces insectorum RCEF 264]|uniref:cyclin-dependent kinase n=1 Tax=Niveomyces insectorum RCEF 264 TaxID=1081102 RepID=A0A167QX12_9HYPO|nr:cyclin-dependent kinase G-1 [Niveomyces insectorum RCEF 264]
MASAAKSRWADTEEDAAFDAKRRKDKEEKKRLKAAERARKEAAAREQQQPQQADGRYGHRHSEDRPSKRRKLTPERGEGFDEGWRDDAARGTTQRTTTTSTATAAAGGGGEGPLLRLAGGALSGPCRSVEHYEKLNDIEEGAYGWVARARDRATGRVVALKRLKLDAADRGGVPVTGLREIQLLKDCAHRNVVALHEVVVGERRPLDR